jgi:hypothetical protein
MGGVLAIFRLVVSKFRRTNLSLGRGKQQPKLRIDFGVGV